jgi:hypothetical protein
LLAEHLSENSKGKQYTRNLGAGFIKINVREIGLKAVDRIHLAVVGSSSRLL